MDTIILLCRVFATDFLRISYGFLRICGRLHIFAWIATDLQPFAHLCLYDLAQLEQLPCKASSKLTWPITNPPSNLFSAPRLLRISYGFLTWTI